MGGALQLWLPVERFDEAMLLLRRTLRWTLLDITYTVMFDSHAAAAVRWDGKSLKPTPKVAVRADKRGVASCRASVLLTCASLVAAVAG